MTTTKHRLQFLDAMRGIAVLLVIFCHAMHNKFALVQQLDAHYFQIGQAGVSLFFLISGYIIPKSLHASPSVKVFWMHRVFRLYPAYWACIALVIVLSSVDVYGPENPLSAFGVFFNFTMLQGFVGIQNVINVFWSLKFEMVFYFLMTAIALSGMLKRPFLIFMLYSIFTIGLATGMRLVLHKFFSYGVFNLELMLLGWVLAEWHLGRLHAGFAVAGTLVGLAAAMVGAAAAFYGRNEELGAGTLTLLPMASAWVLSIVFFCAVLATSHRCRWPRLLAWIGTVSYSAYLLHPIVLALLPSVIRSKAVLVPSEFLCTFLLAWLGYRCIETPSIAFGKKFVAHMDLPSGRGASNR